MFPREPRSPSPRSTEREGGLRPCGDAASMSVGAPSASPSASASASSGDDDAAPPRVAVVTDSAAALPDAWLRAFEDAPGFALVDMPVLISGQLYTACESDTLSSLVVALAEGTPVTTSRPAPGQLRAAYRRFEE